jgi:hypothetical protein
MAYRTLPARESSRPCTCGRMMRRKPPTPVVPELPTKWGPCETIEESAARIVLKIGWRYYCIEGGDPNNPSSTGYMWANKDNREPAADDARYVIPLPIAAYLLARRQSLQGGA